MLLEKRVALVTGGGRGLGRTIARKFAAEGAAVFLTARTEKEIQSVATEIQAAGGRAAYSAGDATQEADCERIVRAAREAFGRVDILVNNAGIFGPVKLLEELTPKEWDEVIAINLRAPFLISRLVLPEMYKRGSGNILNISSISSKMALQLQSAYTATKAAINGLTRAMAAEGARKGVRVNALVPGPLPETQMSQNLGHALAERFQADPDKLFAQFIEGILQGRPQTTEEVAAAALFLVSDQASAITGQSLNVDGGMSFC
jgi:NAD(P)-dependent dehydrogenase (short-subunit alcohol dehydrogenase family)